MRHDFSDTERFAAIFDAEDRDEWQKPEEVVALMQIEPGMVVADLGAGTGYFLPHISRALNGEGEVHGLDTEAAMVEYMNERITRENIANASARVVDPAMPGFAPESVDRVLIVDTWHHIEDRVAYGEKLLAGLRAGGRVVIVDFTQETDMGPPREHRVRIEQVQRELEEAGFVVEIADESLPDQFVVIGTKGA